MLAFVQRCMQKIIKRERERIHKSEGELKLNNSQLSQCIESDERLTSTIYATLLMESFLMKEKFSLKVKRFLI